MEDPEVHQVEANIKIEKMLPPIAIDSCQQENIIGTNRHVMRQSLPLRPI